jgi:hypothetical protein
MQINNTTMNYENIYEGYYLKYYSKVEFLIKNFLVKRHSQKKTFGNSYNEVIHYLSNDFVKKHNLYKNEKLENAYRIFCKRGNIYFVDEVQEIFKNEINIEFDKINTADLPANYTYNQFIKDVALLEAVREILRLFSNHERLYAMVYELNEFDKFEVKVYGNLALEDYPSFKILHSKLYPANNDVYLINQELGLLKDEILNLKEKQPFKIGLKFAIGEPQELYKKYKKEKGHFKMICLELGFKESDRPYFSETLPNTSKSNKNLFNNVTLLKHIAKYCRDLQINMCEDFLEKIKVIELE